MALKNPILPVKVPGRKFYQKAEKIVRDALEAQQLLLSSQLIGEIYHVLTSRGIRMHKQKAGEIILNLLESERTIFRATNEETVRLAIELSTKTGIHIWVFW